MIVSFVLSRLTRDKLFAYSASFSYHPRSISYYLMHIPGKLFYNCWTCCSTMLVSTLVILIRSRSRNFVISEHTNITIFFAAYSESQSVLIVHVGDMILTTWTPNTDWLHFHETIIVNCFNISTLRKRKLPLLIAELPLGIYIKMFSLHIRCSIYVFYSYKT